MNPPTIWKRRERWLAFALTFFGICAFLSIVPVREQAAALIEQRAAAALEAGDQSFAEALRAEAREIRAVGHWTSLLPPLIAIMVAIFFRSIVGALLSAFLVGSFLSFGLNPLATLFLGLNDFLIRPVFSRSSAWIILFLFALVGMVHVMARSGGLSGCVAALEKVIRSRRQAKLAVGLGGVALFFDHYASVVVLGTTMQRLSDRWRISREKLAYLVDSTTAPVAGMALLSTWTAFEVFALADSGASAVVGSGGYGLLRELLPYRFYCLGTLMFLFLNAALGRDFGPMLKAERRALVEGKLVGDDHEKLGIQPSASGSKEREAPGRWINAALPIGVVVATIALGIAALGFLRLTETGSDFSLGRLADWRAAVAAVVSEADGGSVGDVLPILFLASALGGLMAVALPVVQRALSIREASAAYARGLPTMWMAIFILAMTWSMREICATLGTAHYMIAMLGDGMPIWILPLLSFLVAAAMAFATGSSWGTLGILFPILMPMAIEMGALQPEHLALYLLTAAAILDGAIFGDHCSPISDTTVLSSISTGCDHIAHVSTQLYYALVTVALVCLFGYLSVSQSMPLWTFYLLFPAAAFGILRFFGRRSDLVGKLENEGM